ncbi:MAG TPA: DUF6498-containing protein [Patescibacteria group bacterium]|nr:DUF6498-containing protein [Patescibacteria group bacterium]
MTVGTLGRAFELYRRTADSRSAIALLIANAIPLVGVLFFGWSLLTILVLFWIENGIVGFWNVPKILLARQSIVESMPAMLRAAGFNEAENRVAAEALEERFRHAPAQITVETSGTTRQLDATALLSRFGTVGHALLALFFLVHYGMFWFVHGIFVFAMPHFFGAGGASCIDARPSFPAFPSFPEIPVGPRVCASPFGDVVWSNVTIAAIALFLSHGASFLLNYVGKREYLATSPTRQMAAPYGRVVVLHLTILFGAFAIAFIGAPVAALVILVVLKTALDLRLHLRERQRNAPPPAQPSALGATA